MKYFIDIDNTICRTDGSNYETATPITERIDEVNKLYDSGHHITYWTGRGGISGTDWSELTAKQLASWGAKHHALLIGKPDYDLYVDDKSVSVDVKWPVVKKEERVVKSVKVEKGWGWELIITNTPAYCGKILHFNQGGKFSMHYHLLKQETWYVNSGRFIFKWIDTSNADILEQQIGPGDVVTNKVGSPHQIICLEEGDIFEVSTEHFDTDSYRVMKGDSQRIY